MLILFVYIFLIVILDTIGHSIIQYAHTQKNFRISLFAIIFYTLAAMLLYLTYNYKKIGIVITLINGISIIFAILSGYLFFEQKIVKDEFIGILLIIAGIIIIQIKTTEVELMSVKVNKRENYLHKLYDKFIKYYSNKKSIINKQI